MHSEKHPAQSHRFSKDKSDDPRTRDHKKRKDHQCGLLPSALPGAHQFREQRPAKGNQADRKQKFQYEITWIELVRSLRPQTDRREHHTKGGYSANEKSIDERLLKVPALYGLNVRAEQVNELVSFHDPASLPIRRAKALRPLCTDTFTADSDIPDRAAASLTLSPSSFT